MYGIPSPVIEPTNPKQIAQCKFCHDDLFEGESVIAADGECFCSDDCFIEYAMEALGYVRTSLGRV